MENKNIDELLVKGMNVAGSHNITVDYHDEDILFIESLDMLPKVYASKLYANIFCFCMEGRMELDVNGVHFVLHSGETFVCPSGAMIDNVLVSPEFKFTIMCLTDRIIQSLLSANVTLWHRAVYLRNEHIVKPSDNMDKNGHRRVGWHFLEVIHASIDAKDNPFRKEIIRSLLQAMLLGFALSSNWMRTAARTRKTEWM